MSTSSLGGLTLAAVFSLNAFAQTSVHDEVSLVQAIAMVNSNRTIERIVFERDAHIVLHSPVVYTGSQPLTLVGNGATIDGKNAGSFSLDNDLTAITEDGTLVFNTAASLKITDLTIANSATRGLVVNIPGEAVGGDAAIVLDNVKVLGSALYGLHIDDNADAFDDGSAGSNIGVELTITHFIFTGNGTGAIDFDGVRVDERANGGISAVIRHTRINGNGGDGIELDEAGAGNVDVIMSRVSLNKNGFYNEQDLDDGFDIDEAGEGDITVKLVQVEVLHNQDEGLDFDEENEGSLYLDARLLKADSNFDEAIKLDEENAGDIDVQLREVTVANSGDDGIQLTELGDGAIGGKLIDVTAENNAKYGIKAEQWFVEDETAPIEEAGYLVVKRVDLSGNGKGDDIATNNIAVR